MELLIVRQFDEWLDLKTGKQSVTSFKPIGKMEEENIDIVAIELSKKQAGIFWVQCPMERKLRYSMFSTYEEKEEGAPNYETFKAGYQNGKQIFPKIGEVKSSAVKE